MKSHLKKPDLFEESKKYHYVFFIKSSILTDTYDINPLFVNDFKTSIYNAVKESQNKKFGADIDFSYDGFTCSIYTKNFELKEPIEKLMGQIKEVLPDLLLFLKDKPQSLKHEDVSEKLQSYLLYLDYDKKLVKKAQILENKKMKI